MRSGSRRRAEEGANPELLIAKPGSGIRGWRFAWNFSPSRLNSIRARHTVATMEPTDEDLIAACAAGDRQAFATLYRRRRPDVYRFALHMTGSPPVAEDIVQDVFLALMRDAGRYRAGPSGFLPWLLGIARNYSRRHAAQRPMHPLDEMDEPGCESDDTLARDEELALLKAGLAALPPRYREAVVLCDLEELPYAEAAKVIGCAVGTVRSRLHRGRARLAVRLKRELRRETGARVPKWIL